MDGHCRSITHHGPRGLIVDIECHTSNNLPTIVIIGLAGKTVYEAKDRLRGAFHSSKLSLPRKRITLNLAPADLPKADTGLDAAMATAIMVAAGYGPPLTNGSAVLGELGLDGSLRPVRGIIGKLLAGQQHGITHFFIPAKNLTQAKLVPNIRLTPLPDLAALAAHMRGGARITPVSTGTAPEVQTATLRHDGPTFSDVSGQASAKRALVIAAAGGHNILLHGPPGSGKSLLMQCLPGLLPPLTYGEIMEVTQLNSLHNQRESLVTKRPLRQPHHRSSQSVIMGSPMLPGEIALSHHGILLLDEMPEFSREVLEALRQPLESRQLQVTRGPISATYPCNFMLAATANPCPCGFAGSDRCSCTAAQLQRYSARLSGPILDRIDLNCAMEPPNHAAILKNDDASWSVAQHSVAQARQRQYKRYQATACNAVVPDHIIRSQSLLTKDAKQALQTAAERLLLSSRGYMRVLRTARTIADLANSTRTKTEHIGEALFYRQ